MKRSVSQLAAPPQSLKAPRSGMIRTLYISYDGVLEPLGESQVVAYLERLSWQGEIALISFEKRHDLTDSKRLAEIRSRLAEGGIEWIPLRYHKWPSVASTAYDVLKGIATGILLTRSGRLQLVHARGYVGALIALALKRLFGMKFLFDMRGFWADEKVDGGHWSRRSPIYKITKRCEKRFFESADAIVSLTYEGVKAFPELGYRIRSGIPIEVIPTCTDLEKFAPGPKDATLASRLGLDGHLVIGCTGSLSNWYLRRPMLDCLSYLARNLDNVKILIVTREDHERLRSDALRAGIPEDRLVLTRAPFAVMPEYLRLMDLGLFFIKVCFSKRGSSATKLGEFLATGIPVAINDGVGDSGRIVREHRVGVVLPRIGLAEFEASLHEIRSLLRDPLVGRRCRDAARKYFDLNEGSARYAALYDKLVAPVANRQRWRIG